MAKRKKQVLTVSGYEYDDELARVSIKVFPALQALIANQLDLIEIAQKSSPENQIFLENHKAELLQVEEEIAKAFLNFARKKEARKSSAKKVMSPENEERNLLSTDEDLEQQARKISPGLPSAKFEPGKTPPLKSETNIKRIAVGASIKAVQEFLGRELTKEEIEVIENQVDFYLK